MIAIEDIAMVMLYNLPRFNHCATNAHITPKSFDPVWETTRNMLRLQRSSAVPGHWDVKDEVSYDVALHFAL